MRVDLTSEPGDPRVPNEDFAAVAVPSSGTGGALVLLDGVTPPAEDYGCRHSVAWFTARLGGALQQLLLAEGRLTLAECLSRAIARTAEAHQDGCDLSHRRTPQATVVLARWDEERVDHLVLSDSVLLLESPDGEVRPVLDRRLTGLPERVRRLRQRVRRAPEGSAEHARLRREYVAAVEGLRNAPVGSGFFTAAADPTVARHAVVGDTPRDQVRSLLALTDGAGRWVEVFQLGDWAKLLGLVRQEGTESLVARVREAERADPEGREHRRGKPHDDASAVWVTL
ncbi:hypothetical protein [Streptomyces sp. NPDC005438]|uniref:hypothetical protein n=1 Tax=Streptomyces sp. NPDC005438 TaxID=3156880 RepID=UPI0033B017E9